MLKNDVLWSRSPIKAACAVYLGYHVARVVICVAMSDTLPAFASKALALLLGVFCADLFSGIFHLYFDHRRCDLGDGLDLAAYSFRYDHHAYPTSFMKLDGPFYPAGSGEIAAISAPVSLLAHYAFGAMPGLQGAPRRDSAHEVGLVSCLAFVFTAAISHSLHALAHANLGRSGGATPLMRLVCRLQRCNLILSPQVHARHHKGTHDRNFCVVNGWANAVLNPLVPRIFALMRQMPKHFDKTALEGHD